LKPSGLPFTHWWVIWLSNALGLLLIAWPASSFAVNPRMNGHSAPAHVLVLSLLFCVVSFVVSYALMIGPFLAILQKYYVRFGPSTFLFAFGPHCAYFYRWDLAALCIIPVFFYFWVLPSRCIFLLFLFYVRPVYIHYYHWDLSAPCIIPLFLFYRWVLSGVYFYYFYLSLCAVLTERFFYRSDSTYPHLTSSYVVDCSRFISSLRIQISDIYLTLELEFDPLH